MDVDRGLRVFRRNWPVVVLLPILAGAAAIAWDAGETPMYEATSSYYVATSAATTGSDLSQGGVYTEQVVKSFAEIALKPLVLKRVISDLNLETTPEALAAVMSADPPLNTSLLNISATDSSPTRAAAIANATGEALIAVVPELSPSDTSKSAAVKMTEVQSAPVPTSPVSPSRVRDALLAIVAALAVAIGLAFFREAVDTRIRGERDVELVTTRPILGRIGFDKRAKSRPMIMREDPTSPLAEGYRTLRTNLQFLNFQGSRRAFVITSAIAAEGKSSLSTNLALAVADTGETVVLIDADLRRPKVHDYLQLEGGVGLTDVLIGKATLEQALQKWGPNGLMVLPAGRIPPNPSELLQSPAMAELMTVLSRHFKTVIIDAPPLLPVSDAAILSRLAGGAIVVSGAKRSNRRQLTAALRMLEQVEATVLGLVLTMLPTKGSDSYSYGSEAYTQNRKATGPATS